MEAAEGDVGKLYLRYGQGGVVSFDLLSAAPALTAGNLSVPT